MVDLSTLDIASLTFNGWILSLFLPEPATWSNNSLSFCATFLDFLDILCSTIIILLELGWLLLFESLFLSFDSSLLDSSLNIQLGILSPWLSSSLLLPALILSRGPLWPSAFQSGSGKIWRAPHTFPTITGYMEELTHITLQCPL